MHRFRKKTNNLLEVREPWRDCGWTVQLTVNNRQSITNIVTTCTKRIGADVVLTGTAVVAVAPFDDLADLIGATLTDSALDALDQLQHHQDPLFEDPIPR